MMESNLLMERLHFVKGVDPVANAFAATVVSDVINMAEYDRVLFIIYKGAGAVGTTVVTVLACDNTTPSNTTAIPFHYRRACASTDVEGAVTAVAATGFTTTAAASEFYLVEVQAADLVGTSRHYVQLSCTEGVANAVSGCILAVVSSPRYGMAIKDTAIV